MLRLKCGHPDIPSITSLRGNNEFDSAQNISLRTNTAHTAHWLCNTSTHNLCRHEAIRWNNAPPCLISFLPDDAHSPRKSVASISNFWLSGRPSRDTSLPSVNVGVGGHLGGIPCAPLACSSLLAVALPAFFVPHARLAPSLSLPLRICPEGVKHALLFEGRRVERVLLQGLIHQGFGSFVVTTPVRISMELRARHSWRQNFGALSAK